ncbi:MAG: hypothetical protein AAFY56_15100 [Pseudomonadota bacterium]
MAERIAGPYSSERPGRVAALIVYGLYIISLFSGVPMFIGAIIAYLARGEARGTPYESHLSYCITIFWVVFISGIIAAVLWFTVILIPVAAIIFGIVWLWMIYRLVRGSLRLLDDRPAPGADIL